VNTKIAEFIAIPY